MKILKDLQKGQDDLAKRLDSVDSELALMKYRIQYDCWQNVKAAQKKPKKKDMSQKQKENFVQTCDYTCQVTGRVYSTKEFNRKEAAISHICPQSSDKIPPSIQSIHDFRNLAYFNKQIEEAFDGRRLRFIKCPETSLLTVDIVDPSLKSEIFDRHLGTTFESLQGVALDIRHHRPSFVMMSEHAVAAAVNAEKRGWIQGAHADILGSTLKNGIYKISPTKEEIKQLNRILFTMKPEESRPEHTATSSGAGRGKRPLILPHVHARARARANTRTHARTQHTQIHTHSHTLAHTQLRRSAQSGPHQPRLRRRRQGRRRRAAQAGRVPGPRGAGS